MKIQQIIRIRKYIFNDRMVGEIQNKILSLDFVQKVVILSLDFVQKMMILSLDFVQKKSIISLDFVQKGWLNN